MMKQTNFKLSHLGALVALSVVTATANAETLTVPATVTVDNTINFALTGTFDVGTIRATADPTSDECVGIVIPANPATATSAYVPGGVGQPCNTGAGDAEIQIVGGSITRPQFDITGLAAFTTLTVTVPTTATSMTLNPAPAGAPELQLINHSVYQSSGTAGNVTLTTGSGSIVADASGNITFLVGATIITDPGTPTLAYENTGYAGSFDVTVAY
ncbi:hypothetical protein [Alteromonas facilis]|uniref:hypothetical protein n=1 Tax=Alteromonas facilis TaxID=2048004 RepID=UPI000F5C2B8C|nr:hypothetical protein [Alteromonas facilis]